VSGISLLQDVHVLLPLVFALDLAAFRVTGRPAARASVVVATQHAMTSR
jgi:hypothetical protein